MTLVLQMLKATDWASDGSDVDLQPATPNGDATC